MAGVSGGQLVSIRLVVNDRRHQLDVDAGETLLATLRERLALIGPKEACGEGECGACTVLLDGGPVASCILAAGSTDGRTVRTVEGLAATGELTTLALSNLEIATVTMAGVIDDEVVLLPQQVAPGGVEIVLDLEVPEGYKFNTDGLFEFEWSAEGDLLSPQGTARYEARGPEMPVRLTATVDADSGAAVLTATAVVFYCPAVDETFCLIRDVNFTAPIEVDPAGANSIQLPHQLLSAEELEQRLGTG